MSLSFLVLVYQEAASLEEFTYINKTKKVAGLPPFPCTPAIFSST
jgi:hypothetical protein